MTVGQTERRPWDGREDSLIREHYPVHGKGWDGWGELLPGRSLEAISFRASRIGATRRPRWTAGEDRALRELAASGADDWASRLEGRSPEACLARAKALGIVPKRSRAPRWTPEETRTLLVLSLVHGQSWEGWAEALPGRNPSARRNRLARVASTGWSVEEDHCLILHYGTWGPRWTGWAKRLPGRSETSIRARAAFLGICHIVRRNGAAA